MATRRHMAMSVRGALRNSDAALERNLGGAIAVEGKTLHSGKEIRLALERELALGHEKIPMCDEGLCPDFDHLTGCPGHEMPGVEVN